MVRPALGLAVCEARGGFADCCRPAALAVELVHRTPLVFDDIQDHSPRRNGRPTVWQLWGADQALAQEAADEALRALKALQLRPP